MKVVVVVVTLALFLGLVGVVHGKSNKNPGSSSGGGYSQPIVSQNFVSSGGPNTASRHDSNMVPSSVSMSYAAASPGYIGQPVGAASSNTEYYHHHQPVDTAYGYHGNYGRQNTAYTPANHHTHNLATPHYEPVPQSSHPSHAYHYPIKRGHAGWGWGGGHESGINYLIIPLLLIPLLLCWPWFVYASMRHPYPIVYAAPGWKRSSDGKAPKVVEDKIDELTGDILPKISKQKKKQQEKE